ncbi:MAG: hypothetical protein ACLQU3_08905, partial [Limisphaerales bacterium]
NGLVGRDGVFWVENVALNAGTNSLALTLSNPAGSTTTNFTLIGSSIGLSVNTVQAGDTTVSGTIGASGYTIWVNGVQASQNSGVWSAQIAPLGVQGGLVTVTACPNSGPSLNSQATVEAPQGVFISQYHHNQQRDDLISWNEGWAWQHSSDVLDWQDGRGGTNTVSSYVDYLFQQPKLDETDWPATAWPQALTNGAETTIIWYDSPPAPPTVTTNTSIADPPVLPQEHCDINQTPCGGPNVRRTADTDILLATGGPLGSAQKNLWAISASPIDVATGQPIPYDQVLIGGFGKLGTDGNLYVVLPDNDPTGVTPKVPGNDYYTRPVGAQEYPLKILANGVALDPAGVVAYAQFCVGHFVRFQLETPPAGVTATNFHWALSGSYVNDSTNAVPDGSPPASSDNYFENDGLLTNAVLTNCWWVSGRFNPPETNTAFVTYTLIFTNGNPPRSCDAKGLFTMHSPQIYGYLGSVPSAMITNGRLRAVPAGGFTAFIHSGFDGQVGATQLLRGYATNATPSQGINTTNTWELDTQEFYITPLINPSGLLPVVEGANGSQSGNAAYITDNPGVLCNGSTALHLDFQDYIRFQPEGNQAIFVTLATVNWHIYATAGLSNSVYVLTSNPVGYADPAYTDSSQFPCWTNVATGSH